MSTRAQIIVKDEYGELWFYRHSDGYPECVRPQLEKLLKWVKEGRIRSNVEQAAGWLVIMGYQEYLDYQKNSPPFEPATNDNTGMSWKVGAYEPCMPEEHGDIAYLYTVNLTEGTIKVKKSRK
jgi:hypothetical protein